jgi:hypothetical protein
MGLIDHGGRLATMPAMSKAGLRPHPPRRFVSEFEDEIRQLYVRTIDEPIPSRLIEVLRTGLAGHKP